MGENTHGAHACLDDSPGGGVLQLQLLSAPRAPG